MARYCITTNGDSLQENRHVNDAITYLRYALPQHKWINYKNWNGGRSIEFGVNISKIQANVLPWPDADVYIYYTNLKTNSSSLSAQQAADLIGQIFNNIHASKPQNYYCASSVFAKYTNDSLTAPDYTRCTNHHNFNVHMRTNENIFLSTYNIAGFSQFKFLDSASLIMPNQIDAFNKVDPGQPDLVCNPSNITVYGSRRIHADNIHLLTRPIDKVIEFENPQTADRLGGYGTDWQVLSFIRFIASITNTSTLPNLWGINPL